MAFLNDMKDKVTLAGQSAVQKTKDFTETAKLNSAIAETQRQINNLFEQIGAEVYRTCQDDPQPEIAQLIEQVKDLYQNIDLYQTRIREINSQQVCPSCGMKLDHEALFCSSCGAKIETEKCSRICPACGTKVEDDALFCASCGAKLEAVSTGAEKHLCPRCGAEQTDEAVFCANCGSPLSQG